MKVNSTSSGITPTTKNTRPSAAPKAKSAQSAHLLALQETVNLTLTDSEPVFDSEKVNAIKAAIAEGRFTINPDAIADRLINEAKT